jgi:hypothetical protein
MRDIIILSMICELIVVGGAILAGVPVLTTLKTVVSRSVNTTILLALGLVSWVFVGIIVNHAVRYIPGDRELVSGPLRIGDIDFDVTVFVPMVLYTLMLFYVLAQPLFAAWKGRSLRDCIRAPSNETPRHSRIS